MAGVEILPSIVRQFTNCRKLNSSPLAGLPGPHSLVKCALQTAATFGVRISALDVYSLTVAALRSKNTARHLVLEVYVTAVEANMHFSWKVHWISD